MKAHDERILSLVVLSNGDLASGGDYNTIKIWDTNNGSVKQTLTGHTSWIRYLVALENNDLASASDDKTIIIWNINEKRVEKTLTGHTEGLLT